MLFCHATHSYHSIYSCSKPINRFLEIFVSDSRMDGHVVIQKRLKEFESAFMGTDEVQVHVVNNTDQILYHIFEI